MGRHMHIPTYTPYTTLYFDHSSPQKLIASAMTLDKLTPSNARLEHHYALCNGRVQYSSTAKPHLPLPVALQPSSPTAGRSSIGWRYQICLLSLSINLRAASLRLYNSMEGYCCRNFCSFLAFGGICRRCGDRHMRRFYHQIVSVGAAGMQLIRCTGHCASVNLFKGLVT
jgi:hypothetical protein